MAKCKTESFAASVSEQYAEAQEEAEPEQPSNARESSETATRSYSLQTGREDRRKKCSEESYGLHKKAMQRSSQQGQVRGRENFSTVGTNT